MSFFSKSSFVFWPQKNSTQIYCHKKENNTISFDVDLWKKQSAADLQPLKLYLKKNRIKSGHFLLSDEIIVTRSFIYDSQINSIDKKEIVALAKDFVSFDIDDHSIDSELIPGQQKTVIRAHIYHRQKIKILLENLSLLGLKNHTFSPLSQTIANLVKTFYSQEYFFLFPLSSSQFLLILAKGDLVFLTATLKGTSLDIQKIINYSKLYFSAPIKKIFTPNNDSPDLVSTTSLEKTGYDSSQIAQNLNLPTNLPLPVIGSFILPNKQNTDIIKSMNEDQLSNSTSADDITSISSPKKKKVLPILAVFIFTAALASIVIWFVLNRSDSGAPGQALPTSPATAPTVVPTSVPTIADIEKDLKIQVLNATNINGQAAYLKEKLLALGFTDITLGNSSQSLSVNQVKLKKTDSDLISAYFKSKIADVFPATYDPGQADADTYDIVFIIGTDIKNSNLTPTAVATTIPDTTEDKSSSDL